ncbi:site-specific integrase, partial [Escherichia coli]|nr:site-specific integrase [Escherichia coli]
ALGMLHDKLSTKGVKFVGYWPTEGYEFTSPKPVIADGQLFVGLTLATAQSDDLQALLAERLEGGYKATSSARLLSAVRRLFQY